MSRERPPGSVLLHPLTAFSLAALVFNDHFLKHAHPGWLSGKISDFAAVFLLPVFLLASFELGYRVWKGRTASALLTNRALLVGIAVTGLVYAPPELWRPAEAAYRYGVGALQWPFRIAFAWLSGHAAPALRPVRTTADVTDLIALPMLWVAWRVARRSSGVAGGIRSRRDAPRTLRRALIALLGLGVLGFASVASAAKSAPYTHDGLYLGFEAGPEFLYLHSPNSVSNGFIQPIASRATGFAPGGTLELGGTLPQSGLVLGGSLAFVKFDEPVVHTLGTSFVLKNAQLSAFDLALFVKYYPDPRGQLSFEVSVAGMGLDAADGGHELRGPSLALEAGYGGWLARQWSLGIAARVTAADLHGDLPGATLVLIPGVFATIAWH